MDILLRPVHTPGELKQFVVFPWAVYKDDPNWVPPIIEENIKKLDPGNKFWRSTERELWIAEQDGKPVGTVAAFIERAKSPLRLGSFGFFECLPDQAVANALLDAAAKWLKEKGMQRMRGPYNPSVEEEFGILVEGFDTRPAIMEAHTPAYYPPFFETTGFRKYKDWVAMLFSVPPGVRALEEVLPEKVRRAAALVRKNPRLKGLEVRPLRREDWENEVRTACMIYNAALSSNRGSSHTAVSEAEFLALASSLKPLIDPDFALVATIEGKPVAFALALPDYNQALQHLNGRLGKIELLKLWWYSRRLKRLSFKMWMVLPEYQVYGLGPLLAYEILCAGWRKGFRQLDGSTMSEDNVVSIHLQESGGMKVYRKYRIYERDL